MRITVFRDMKQEGWPSMDRYADRLVSALRKQSTDQLFVSEFSKEIPTRFPLPLRPSRYVARLFLYPRHARGQQGDLNHIIDHSYGHLLYALDPSRTVVTCHDVFPLSRENHVAPFKVSSLVWNRAYKGMLKAARIICDSEFTRKELLSLSSYAVERTEVVPLGVDSSFSPIKDRDRLNELREKTGPGQEFILLHVGHCGERKNIEGLLNIAAGVKRRGLDMKLVQVGGLFTNGQRQLIDTLKLGDSVIQLPKVSEEELVLLYNIADVFVYPSLYEGFGLPPLEAMACGIPVVTTNAASLPEVVGKAAISLDPRDVEGFAEAVVGLLRNESLYKSLVEAGFRQSALFSWDNCARKTLAVYEALYRECGETIDLHHEALSS